jgi:hypothetical protein
MSLPKLVAFIEDGPWCGTKPPGFHPLRPGHTETFVRNLAEVALNPQPLPPSPETAAYLWQAVRLYQYGNLLTAAKVPGNVAEALLGEAVRIYDDGDCGTVPWNIILQWLRHPPPPPPPWLDVVAQAATNVLIANKLSGDIGKQLLGAAVSVIQGEIGQAKARTRSAAA